MSKSQSSAPPGQPTHTPKIRIRGAAAGSPEYNALVDRYSGLLGNFIARSQQQVQISGNHQYRAKTKWPGAFATYHNNNGQETIDLTVYPEGGAGEEKPPVQTPWEFALVEFVVDRVGDGEIHFAAFMTHPTAAQRAMTSSTFLPVQGVTRLWDENDPKPIIAFAGVNPGTNIGSVYPDPSFTASLRVDLRNQPFQVVEVDIYAFVEPWSEIGIPRDGGVVVSSDWYGAISRDMSGASLPMTPGQMAGYPESKLHIQPATASFGRDRLIACFPELAAYPYEYANMFDGRDVAVTFVWDAPSHAGIWWADPLLVSPNTSPGDFIIAGAYTETDTFWAPGFQKTQSIDGMVIDYGSGGIATATITTPHPDGSNHSMTITYERYTAYFVATVEYATGQPCTINAVCARQGNPWEVYSFHDNDTTNDSALWEVESTYPERPKMKQLDGNFMIPSQAAPSFLIEDLPSEKFGMPLMGTLKIDTRTGSVAFEPV